MRKKIAIVLGAALILAGAGWWAWDYFDLAESWEIAKFNVDSQRAIKALENYFKNDSYGGQTPPETYALYLEALKRGDLDTASLYFFWERQVEQKRKLEDLKAKGELEKYIVDLPKWGELKEEEYGDPSTKQYSYEFIQEKDEEYFDELLNKKDIKKAGKYRARMDFQFNGAANIWKIYSL